MNTKLTLTIERSVISDAKKYAEKKGRSLSDLVESYLKAITGDAADKKRAEAPVSHSLRGAFRMPEDFDYKTALAKGLAEKYLTK